ncbi:dirigent protein 22-like [Iris pallida]|uniref:Dirigent protein n=1 Tax=Iris pallida TaxID=29817 RepID=A0AAX6EGV0_IRIPA|nr:dirigent protein 22-like [Iris pallida]
MNSCTHTNIISSNQPLRYLFVHFNPFSIPGSAPMAKVLLVLVFLFVLNVSTTTPLASAARLRREKLSHFQFYWHDILSGRSPTAVPVARAPPGLSSNATGFGQVTMIDDPLTLGPTINSSSIVGRAQGFYACAALDTVGLMMVMNFVFHEGRYNGSTFTVMGRNEVFKKVREMPVVGGSGAFRFARGYVEARTHWFDLNTGDAIVHYDCFVMHY